MVPKGFSFNIKIHEYFKNNLNSLQFMDQVFKMKTTIIIILPPLFLRNNLK